MAALHTLSLRSLHPCCKPAAPLACFPRTRVIMLSNPPLHTPGSADANSDKDSKSRQDNASTSGKSSSPHNMTTKSSSNGGNASKKHTGCWTRPDLPGLSTPSGPLPVEDVRTNIDHWEVLPNRMRLVANDYI